MALQLKSKRIFYVNSGDQLTSSSGSFSQLLQIEPGEKYDRVTVLQANIPVSYYLVQDGQNTFVLTENGTSVTLTIPAGNYNINSFSLYLQDLLTNNSPNGIQYTCTYPNGFLSNNTGKITYTASSTILPISFTFSNKLNEQFGFPANSTVNFRLTIPDRVLTSENVVKFVPEDTIFIHSNLVGEYSDVLQEIYAQNSGPLTTISYLATDPLSYSKKLSSSSLRNATFSITDENKAPLYLNGLNMNLTLMLYREPDYYEKSTQFMKYQLERDLSEANEANEVNEPEVQVSSQTLPPQAQVQPENQIPPSENLEVVPGDQLPELSGRVEPTPVVEGEL